MKKQTLGETDEVKVIHIDITAEVICIKMFLENYGIAHALRDGGMDAGPCMAQLERHVRCFIQHVVRNEIPFEALRPVIRENEIDTAERQHLESQLEALYLEALDEI